MAPAPGSLGSRLRSSIAGALGLPEVAERLAHIDPYAGSLERIRDRHLNILSDAIAEGGA